MRIVQIRHSKPSSQKRFGGGANVLKPDTFPRLRINLAHFGHFNKAVQYARPVNYVDKCWEWTIGKIVTGSTEAYAYADISSLGEILKTGPSRKIVECMKAFKEHFPNSHERLSSMAPTGR